MFEVSVDPANLVHAGLVLITAVSSTSGGEADRMASWSGSLAAAEAKKAEGASMHMLLTPSPPVWTGSDAYFHWSSKSWTLRIDDVFKASFKHQIELI